MNRAIVVNRISFGVMIALTVIMLAIPTHFHVSAYIDRLIIEKNTVYIPKNHRYAGNGEWQKELLQEELQFEINLERKKIESELVRIFKMKKQKAERFSHWIQKAYYESNKRVSYAKIASIIYVESSFRVNVSSGSGAIGSMQVKPRYWEAWCGVDLKEPENNIVCGTKIIAHYENKYCNKGFDCAAKMYNVGPTGYFEDQSFYNRERYSTRVKKVMKLMKGSPIFDDKNT
jgi:hypothetical protein